MRLHQRKTNSQNYLKLTGIAMVLRTRILQVYYRLEVPREMSKDGHASSYQLSRYQEQEKQFIMVSWIDVLELYKS